VDVDHDLAYLLAEPDEFVFDLFEARVDGRNRSGCHGEHGSGVCKEDPYALYLEADG
jgi:hypothetical protein